MTLYEALKDAKSEEDVKRTYIKALGIKDCTMGEVDIRTPKIWFEAKKGSDWPTYRMFTELCYYVYDAIKKGEPLPAFLSVIDSEKAAIMPAAAIEPLLREHGGEVPWGRNASAAPQGAVDYLSQTIGTHHTNYRLKSQEHDFIAAIKSAIETGKIPRTPITPNNLKDVYDKWVESIGGELVYRHKDRVTQKLLFTPPRAEDMCLLFYADIMSDDAGNATHEDLSAMLLHKSGRPCFILNTDAGQETYELQNSDGYRNFWATYDRPPAEADRDYLLERRDCLIPTDARAFRGEYYTPLAVVSRAYQLLDSLLGRDWQKEYTVWDPCCGVGNLETKHGNLRNVYMSTLKQEDVDIMAASRTAVAAHRFQYDYLNDDIADMEFDGTFDYDMTGKLPEELRHTIEDNQAGKSKVLVLMNPPYAEAGSGGAMGDKEKVAKTKAASRIMGTDWGKATNELFTQFLARIAVELPNAVIATFSTLKYVNAPNFEKFRGKWNAEYLGGFVVHSKAFDGLKGDFPIGFLVWQTHNGKGAERTPIKEISCEAYNKDDAPVGEKKFYNLPVSTYLNVWIKRPRTNKEEAVPLKNAVSVSTAQNTTILSKWSDGAIGYLFCDTNDFQNAPISTALFSSPYFKGHGIYVTPDNLLQCAVVFTVRRIISHTWLNHNDQFLQPNWGGSPLGGSEADKAISVQEEIASRAAQEGRNRNDERRAAQGGKTAMAEGQTSLRAQTKQSSTAKGVFCTQDCFAGGAGGYNRNDGMGGEIDEFMTDCLVWMLFHGKNLTAGADGLVWGGREWSLTNRFFPYTEDEVGAKSAIESNFMSGFLASLALSSEARSVLDAGRDVYRAYFCYTDPRQVREELKLGRADAGWYQIRNALKARARNGDVPSEAAGAVEMARLDAAYKELTEKLRPKVREYGFLK